MVHNLKRSDGIVVKKDRTMSFDLPLARFVRKYKNNSYLYSPKSKTGAFLTSQSGLYFNQHELERLRKGEKIYQREKKFDSLTDRNPKAIQYRAPHLVYSRKSYGTYDQIEERYFSLTQYIKDYLNSSVRGVSAVRMWNLSIISSLIFGMFLMTMIYRYLGQGAAAREKNIALNPASTALVLGEESAQQDEYQKEQEELAEKILAEQNETERKAAERGSFAGKIREMTKGYPIEKMAPDIARQDKIVAAFMVSIAKKESDWGKHVPVLDGKDCYNYWGFRAQRERMGTGGHTCFNSPSDAVYTVSRRIKNIIEKEKIKTPQGMVTVWKCGYDCSWDSPAAVRKWVSDVDGYFAEVKELEK